MAETRVRVVITGDSRQAQSAVQRLQREFSGLGDGAAKLNRSLAGLGAGLSVGALVSAFRGAITELDSFNDAAEKTGISVEKLSGLVEELAPAGVSLQQITDLASKLSRAMNGADEETSRAAEAFKALGVETKDAAGNFRPVDDVLREVAQSLTQYADGSNKTILAQALLGKSASEYLPTLNDIAETTGKVGSVTAEAAKQAEEMQRQFNALGRAALDLRNDIALAIIPSLLNLNEQFKAGKEAAGGFWNAVLRFGVLASPFDSAGDQINDLIRRRDDLTARLSREDAASSAPGAFGAGARRRASENAERLRAELAQLERDLSYFRVLQRQGVDLGADNMDARDRLLQPTARPQAPRLPNAEATGSANRLTDDQRRQADAAAAAAARTYDAQIKALFATQELTSAQKLALDSALQAAPLELRANEERAQSAAALADIYRQTAEERAAAIKEATKSEEEDYKALAKLSADAREERERLVKTYRDLLDPLEQYRKKLQEITRLEGLGSENGLSSDEAQRAREVVLEQMDRAGSDVRDFRDTTAGAFGDLQRSIEAWSDRSADAITEFVTTGKGGFKGMVDAILADLLRLQIQKTVTGPLRDSLPGLFSSVLGAFLGGGGSGILDGDSALALTGADIRARRAGGGDMKGGYPYLVGERGTPEIVIPRTDSTAIPYELLRAAIYEKNVGSSSASPQPVVVNQVLNVGQGADFAMVRQAAALGAAQAQAEFVEARRRGQRWAS